MLLTGVKALAEPSCPATATLTVFADNLSGAPIEIRVEGELARDAVTCAGAGAMTYAETLTCTGSGMVRCGQIGNLRPGAWIHRLEVTIPGSATQRQAQRRVVVGGDPIDVSNALLWTIYPRTFVVGQETPGELTPARESQLRLDQATAYTYCNAYSRALVIFSWDAFPGVSDPKRIELLAAGSCSGTDSNHCRLFVTPDHCPCDPASTSDPCVLTGDFEGTRRAGLCVAGDRITIDALDRNAEAGGVILSVAACEQTLLRLYTHDTVLRGLVLEGSQVEIGDPTTCGEPGGPVQVDTVTITGARGLRNRVEQSLILGPTCGDAVSVERGASDNVIVASRIAGAQDRGLKANAGSAAIERSCVHDNRKGGLLSTLGGDLVAAENVVQHNVGGLGQNGLSVAGTCQLQNPGCQHDRRSTIVTKGNIVRYSGGRGLSVRNDAGATFESDYVANNAVKGSEVETTESVPVDETGRERIPSARFHGVALVCNYSEDDKHSGVGAETRREAMSGEPGSFHDAPDVSYGDAQEPGRNTFTSNTNPSGIASANLLLTNITTPVTAVGNQWGHCTGTVCDVADVLAGDVSPSDSEVQLVAPGTSFDGPRAGFPMIYHVTPARPQAGDIVRIFGDNFDAINGNPTRDVCGSIDLPTCSPDGTCPTGPCVEGTCPCSIENAAVQQRNQATSQAPQGRNRIMIRSPMDGTMLADIAPDAVTPTMLAFRMPFDCYAQVVLEVAKYGVVERTLFCDAKGCTGEPAGAPCDDGQASTVDDHCDGERTCVGDPAPTTSTTTIEAWTTSTSTTTTAFTSTTTTSTLPCVCGLHIPSTRDADECDRRKLHRRAEKLALLIDHAVKAGRQPRCRWARRLTKLLRRCGVIAAEAPC